MPQIANQDYNVVKPAYAEYLSVDAAAMGILAGHIERNTIFDPILEIYPNDYSRIVSHAIYDGVKRFVVIDGEDGSTLTIEIPYNHTQYEGLAAVQVACELTSALPVLESYTGFVIEASGNDPVFICVDGKKVSFSADDNGKIATLTVTSETPAIDEIFANIEFDDLMKLIGVDIAE